MNHATYPTLSALFAANPGKRFYDHPSGLVGLKRSGLVLWFRGDSQGYRQSGSTRTPEGAKSVPRPK
jgi:hypothetical protein